MSQVSAESAVERLLKELIPASPFKNLTYVVGGYVRDQLLGLESKDIDLVVEQKGGAEALSQWLHEQSPESISDPHPMGAGYPIWQIVFKKDISIDGKTFHTAGCEVEIADTQAEAFPDPTTRQRVTVFGNLEEDCRRRDFTANMLYWDLTANKLVDPSGTGASDIRAGILRGHPEVNLEKIFSDDPLRMIRLIRFHCRFGWSIPAEVLDCVKKCVDRLKILSQERLRGEIVKMCVTGRFYLGLELMRETGILPCVFPELLPMIGCTQDKIYHAEGDVWVHTLLAVKNAPATVELQLAALFHDSGKPATRSEHGERIKFLGHESVSEQIAERTLRHLSFENETIRIVTTLVALHMRGGRVEEWSSSKPARKLLRDADDQIENLLDLMEADSKSCIKASGESSTAHIPLLRAAIVKAALIPIPTKSVLTGNEIMAQLGLPPGRKIREVKQFLEELEDDFAAQNKILDKETALQSLRETFGKPAE